MPTLMNEGPRIPRDGSPGPMDGFPISPRSVTFVRWTGTPVPMDGNLFSQEYRYGDPFPRQKDDVPLEKRQVTNCIRRPRRHGQDPPAYNRETTFLLLPRTAIASYWCSWCEGAWLPASSLVSVVESIINKGRSISKWISCNGCTR